MGRRERLALAARHRSPWHMGGILTRETHPSGGASIRFLLPAMTLFLCLEAFIWAGYGLPNCSVEVPAIVVDTRVTRGSDGPGVDSARNKRPYWTVDLTLEKVNDLSHPGSLSSLAKCTEEEEQGPGGRGGAKVMLCDLEHITAPL